MRDPYSMLGVARDANETEIKKAYHGLAKELHPDLNPDDSVVADRFKEVSAAYSMLGDPAMRTRYDNGEIGADGQEKARRHYEYAGGPAGPGDGLVEVNVRAHPQFRREGTDIHMDLPLALADAVLGAKVEVPTINGPVTMTIPKGANNGQTLRLKAKGIKPPKAEQAGNQYIHLRLTLPDPPDPDLTALLEEWARKQVKAADDQPDSQATDTE